MRWNTGTAAAKRTPDGCLTRNGQQLLLPNGAAYRFVGFNLWRANVSFTLPNTGYLVNNGTTLADTLAAVTAGGAHMNVFRAWFFQQLVTPTTSGYTWDPFDKTLSVAAAAGFKVIACLADEWNFEGPPVKDSAWFTTNYATTAYSGTANSVAYNENVPYKQYVADVAARYRNNTAIAFWELGNEFDVQAGGTPQAGDVTTLSNFVTDVTGVIKAADPNHMISLGVGGNGNAGTIGADYQTIHALSGLDLCSFHDYYGAANATAFETNNGLNTRIPQAAAVNKPLYIGECGIHLNTAPVSGSASSRASYLDAKMSAQLAMQGMSGYLPWQFDLRGVGTDDYNYPPADPALAVMGAYCTN